MSNLALQEFPGISMQEVFNQANALHQQGQLQQAEKIYRKILSKAPGQPVVCARLSLLLQQTGRAAEAFPLITIAIKGLPNEFEVLMQGASLAVQLDFFRIWTIPAPRSPSGALQGLSRPSEVDMNHR